MKSNHFKYFCLKYIPVSYLKQWVKFQNVLPSQISEKLILPLISMEVRVIPVVSCITH